MALAQPSLEAGDDVQVTCKFVTKLPAEFRVPETPVVSAWPVEPSLTTACTRPITHDAESPRCCRLCLPTSRDTDCHRSSTTCSRLVSAHHRRQPPPLPLLAASPQRHPCH